MMMVYFQMITILGGGFKHLLFHPYLGKIPILTNIFQMGETTNQYWFIIRKMIVLEVPNCYRFAWLGFHKFHRSKRWIQSDLGPQNMFESLVFFLHSHEQLPMFHVIILHWYITFHFFGCYLMFTLRFVFCFMGFSLCQSQIADLSLIGGTCEAPRKFTWNQTTHFYRPAFFYVWVWGSMLVSGGVPGYHFWFSLVQFRHAICMATLIKPPRKLAVLKQTISSDIQNPFFLFKNLFKCVFFIFLSPKFAILDSLKEAGKKKNQGKAPITSGWFWPPIFGPGSSWGSLFLPCI